jgi:hypothetical protein
MLPHGVELVEYRDGMDGHRHIQMAINGVLAPAIDDHATTRENFATDAAYFAHLAKRSEEFLHLFGSPRSPLSEEEIQLRSQEPF